MQASARLLALRYSRALFACACGQKAEERVGEEMTSCALAMKDVLGLLRHPRVSAAQKREFLRAGLEKKLLPLTADFLELLMTRKRFELLPLVAQDFNKLLLEKKGVVKAKVRAAKPMSAQEQSRLRERLGVFCGKRVELEIQEDPTLVGGAVVRLGDWVFDGSLSGQLLRLKEAIRGD